MNDVIVVALYHVPRSQVWPGSRGGQQGNVHLHVQDAYERGRIKRRPGQALCGRDSWYEKPATHADKKRCPKCASIAQRHGIAWPEHPPEAASVKLVVQMHDGFEPQLVRQLDHAKPADGPTLSMTHDPIVPDWARTHGGGMVCPSCVARRALCPAHGGKA